MLHRILSSHHRNLCSARLVEARIASMVRCSCHCSSHCRSAPHVYWSIASLSFLGGCLLCKSRHFIVSLLVMLWVPVVRLYFELVCFVGACCKLHSVVGAVHIYYLSLLVNNSAFLFSCHSSMFEMLVPLMICWFMYCFNFYYHTLLLFFDLLWS